jgi:geranylgeranyl pyrophosphate synthase
MIRNSEIVPECYRVAQDFTAEACRALEIFPESPCQRALFELADYMVERQK